MKRKTINDMFSERSMPSHHFFLASDQGLYLLPNAQKSISINDRPIAGHFVRISDILMPFAEKPQKLHLILDEYSDMLPYLQVTITEDYKVIWHNQKKFLSTLKNNHVQIRFPVLFLKAYRIYIEAEIEYQNKKRSILKQIMGWKAFDNAFEYLGVHNSVLYKYVDNAFAPAVFEGSDLSETSLEAVLTFMDSFPETLPIFAYLFYSLSQPLLFHARLEPKKPRFALALTGNNTHTTPAELANVILNLFHYNTKRPHAITGNMHISTDSISTRTLLNSFLLHNIPVLVFNKARKLQKSNPKVRLILNKIGTKPYYPVFLSQTEFIAPSVLTLDISSIPDVTAFSKSLPSLHDAILEVVCDFIERVRIELQQIAYHAGQNGLCTALNQLTSTFLENPYADNDLELYASLYSALLLFLLMVHRTEKTQRSLAQSISKKAFWILRRLSAVSKYPASPTKMCFALMCAPFLWRNRTRQTIHIGKA